MKPTVLVVDDEQSILHIVTAYLQAEGYTVHTATDGPAGLKAARAFKPDLIVLDIRLPGMDGIEVLQHLRRESDVYVIMLTAKAEETVKVILLAAAQHSQKHRWQPTKRLAQNTICHRWRELDLTMCSLLTV